MKVVLVKGAAKSAGSISVGDYVEADGWKEHEQLFYADDVRISKR